MNSPGEGGVERLRQLARVSKRVMNRLMAACGRPEGGPGRPCQYALEVQVLVLLVKMRLDLPYRALETISGIDAVTASRRVRRMLERLMEAPLAKGQVAEGFYLVCWRMIHHLSGAWPARVHDKVIWDRTAGQVQPFLDRPVLADKAYAGAFLEGEGLVRPFRHREREYRAQPEPARVFNKELSRRRACIEQVMASLKRFCLLGGRFSLALACYPAVMKVAALLHHLERADT